MCFQIGKTLVRMRRLKTVYKVVELENDKWYSPHRAAKYELDVTKRMPKNQKHTTCKYTFGTPLAKCGLYVYTSLKVALQQYDHHTIVVLQCKVDPRDLLHVSKDGSQATYRALTPVKQVA